MKVGRFDTTALLLGAVVLVGGYVWMRGVKGVVGDVVKTVDTAAGAAVMEVSAIFGIPKTDAIKCGEFLAAGDTWNALAYCPAGTFYRAMTGEVVDPTTGDVVGQTTPGEESIVTLDNPDDVYLLN